MTACVSYTANGKRKTFLSKDPEQTPLELPQNLKVFCDFCHVHLAAWLSSPFRVLMPGFQDSKIPALTGALASVGAASASTLKWRPGLSKAHPHRRRIAIRP